MIQVKVNGFLRLASQVTMMEGVLTNNVRKMINKTVSSIHGRVSSNISGVKLQRRTGTLSRALKTEVVGNKINDLMGRVYFDDSVKYAGIHEYGGTIRPKKSKYLTIPSKFNKTPAGVTRISARDLIAKGNTFVANNTIFQTARNKRFKSGKRAVPMFFLRKSVDIPARMGFYKIANEELEALKARIKQQ